jgi:predicted CXXCH cytochrome family protein
VYGNGTTLSGTPISNPPGTFSLTCLSCHDGSIGIGVISKNGVTSTFAMTGRVVNAGGRMANVTDNNGYNPYIGTDLTNDHPVGFTFPSAGYTPNGGVPGIGIVINTTAPNHLTGANSNTTYPLYAEVSANQFECSTCHDPHLEDGVRGGGAASKFLRSANAGICQDCHNTK